MEPWVTTASMLVQGEPFPFKTTRCFLKITKSVAIFKIWNVVLLNIYEAQ